mgnify:CR=1 FL=1
MHNTTTRTNTKDHPTAPSPTRHRTRQDVVHLVYQLTDYNLTVRLPSLTPIERLSRQMLLLLHHATRPVTDAHVFNTLRVPTSMGRAALAQLLTEQCIPPTTLPTSRTTRATTVDITLTGRIRAQQMTTWTTQLLRFIPQASPRALRELHHSLMICLNRQRQTPPPRTYRSISTPPRRTLSTTPHRTTAHA